MQHPAADAAGLGSALADLLDLSRQARQARSVAELGFLLVNGSLAIAPYRQAALWYPHSGVKCLSGLVQPEANTPYAHWLAAVARHLAAGRDDIGHPPLPHAFTASNLPPKLADEWGDWWPAHGLWVAMPQPTNTQAGLLLARDAPWSAHELALLQDWTETWWHALLALRSTRRRSLLRPWRRDTEGALPGERPWWRRPGLFATAALVAASFIPVQLSVLAPGELVPHNPAVVRSPLDGVVDVFHVQPNERVKKGQPLFGVDEALLQSRLAVANQTLATASTEYRQAMQQALVDPRVRTQLVVLTGRIQEKRAEMVFLREQLTRARVLAPMDGVALFDDPTEWIGKPVTVGERILRIAATGDVEVEAWLPIADAIALAPGAAVNLYLNANPLEPVTARLRYLAHDAVQRPDGAYAYRMRASLDAATLHRVGLKGTVRVQGEQVPAIYWVLRRPIATLRSSLGL